MKTLHDHEGRQREDSKNLKICGLALEDKSAGGQLFNDILDHPVEIFNVHRVVGWHVHIAGNTEYRYFGQYRIPGQSPVLGAV